MSDWKKNFRAWAEGGQMLPDRGRLDVMDASLCAAALLRVALQHPGVPLLVAVSDAAVADRLAADYAVLASLYGEPRKAVTIPEVAAGRRQWHPENEASCCAVLQSALSGEAAVYVAAAGTLLARAMAPGSFTSRSLVLRKGDGISIGELSRKLVRLDYDNEYEVVAPGEFARRGGILDVFSPLYADPVRLEFWGDEIDTIRFFSAETQRSIGEIPECRIIPRGAAVLEEQADQMVPIREFFAPEVPLIIVDSEGIRCHLNDYADKETLDAWDAVAASALHAMEIAPPAALDSSAPLVNRSAAAAAAEPPADSIRIQLDARAIDETLAAALPELHSGKGVALWHWQHLKGQLLRWKQDTYRIVACCAGSGEAERLRELLAQDADTAGLTVEMEHLELPAGLLFPSQHLALLSDQELFGRQTVRRRRRKIDYRCSERDVKDDILEWDPGCYAVHVNHGICRYHGILRKEVDCEVVEAIELEFADEQRLYVPLEQSYLVSKYVGGTKNLPSLSKLGGTGWGKSRKHAEEAAWDLAAELIRLEAMRSASEGQRFKPAVDWERSFYGSFPYELTSDQQDAVEACLQDMASTKPMDRLLCGDVGYGKTEVAIRAAFRAVMNNRQVAVLVPTTVLAQQHYQTFRERMAEYPIRIEMLSRFRSASQQHDVLERLAAGEVDIVIGTHRLVSNDVRFASLGLLIIDEEQRFGVRAKQRLKEMRATVDILTMTATPIPRTLYMSLSGIRNLSTIMTAPSNRLPVNTVVAAYDKELIRVAITREVERGGQVFFLHNRVQTLEAKLKALEALLPNVRFKMAHGQMPPAELERIMTDFVAHTFDVLLCTTIIESGIDIPNANTIIIDRADHFGLSELYQLRGRVGRYFRQAYAYLLLPPMGMLPANARERLAAIRRFSHLGAGFRLALKDLEIRGAGNILGQEQSGHIAAVGFDLYCQLLKTAVARLNHDTGNLPREIQVELEMTTQSLTQVPGKLQCMLPPEYIQEDRARIGVYQHLQTLDTPADVNDYAAELRDRFGPLPFAVKNLMQCQRIRLRARKLGFTRLCAQGGRIVIETSNGLLRPNGHIPLYDTAATPARQLDAIELLLKDLDTNLNP